MKFQLHQRLHNEELADGADLGGAPAEVTTEAPAETSQEVSQEVSGQDAGAVAESTAADAAFFDSLPEDWRQQSVAKLGVEDAAQQEKMLNVLNRYPSYDKFVNAFFDQHKTIKQGAHKQGLPDNPTDEQLAEFRSEAGIPATADEYALPEGLVLDEADTRIMGSVFPVAHKLNLSNEAMAELTDAMLKGREAEIQAITNQHGIDQQTADRQIKQAWGGDYETNKNVIRGLFNGLPEAVRENFMSAQMADGTLVFNSPEFLVWAAETGRQLNPTATVVPNSANPVQSVNDEIEKIEKVMSDDMDAYYKDTKMQARYRELLDARKNLAA